MQPHIGAMFIVVFRQAIMYLFICVNCLFVAHCTGQGLLSVDVTQYCRHLEFYYPTSLDAQKIVLELPEL